MKLVYYNDTEECQMVHQINYGNKDTTIVKPLETIEYDMSDLAEGDKIFIKQWKGQLLVTKIVRSKIEDIKSRRSNPETKSKGCY